MYLDPPFVCQISAPKRSVFSGLRGSNFRPLRDTGMFIPVFTFQLHTDCHTQKPCMLIAHGNHPCPLWNAHYVRSKYGTKRCLTPQKSLIPIPPSLSWICNSSMLRKKLQKYTIKYSPKWW